MKIAFATLYDLRDIERGSGTYYQMAKEMERQGHMVHYIGPIDIIPPLITRVLKRISNTLDKKYRTFQDVFVARKIGESVTRKLENLEYDLLLTNDHGIAGYTETDKPIVLYTDAVFPYNYVENTHPWLENLMLINRKTCQMVNQKGLEQANICVFPTRWAKQEALKYNRIEQKKIEIIPFGANMTGPSDQIALQRSIAKIQKKGKIDLLFVGKDWAIKGGDTAVNTVKELKQRNISANLHIVGSTPPYSVDSISIRCYGLLNKADPNENAMLEGLFHDCDAFILPSTIEGFGIVTAEAAAFGLPVIAYDTIGISDAVKNDESGILLKLGSSEIAFANVIESWLINPDIYDQLVSGARKHFEKTVNWKNAVNKLIVKIEMYLSPMLNAIKKDYKKCEIR